MSRTIIDSILKEIPLSTRIKVSNEMMLMTALTELGFRENKMWTPEEDELLSKLMKIAEQHTQNILNTISEWEKDGKPKEIKS